MEPLAPLHVLAVDDDEDILANLRDILELDNYQVETAATAREALNRTDWAKFSAIIVDRKLPDGSAEELLPHFRKAAPGAAVIIVTGYADLESTISALRHGAVDYILKPIKPEELRARLANVAERKRAEEKINSLAKFPGEAPDPVLRVARDGILLYANLASAPLLRTWKCQVDDIVPESWCKLVQNALASGAANEIECDCDGVTFSMVFAPFADAGYVNLYGRDITERKRALQSERLAAVGQTITGLAHESRNALQRIQASVEMLQLELKDKPEALEFLGDIQKAQDHLHRLYDQLRRYAAPVVLNRAPCHLGDILQESWFHLIGMRKGRDATLREHQGEMDLNCTGDWFALGQVFRNILENSLAASRDPVLIDACWSEAEVKGRPAIRVALRDNGPGLTPEQRRKIFEPFFTTKSQGTGLGMAIAKNIIDAHGGRIEIAPENGQGTEVVIFLPRENP